MILHSQQMGFHGEVINGVLYAGDEAGAITIYAKKGKATASKTMNVLSAPNEIEIIPKKTSMSQNNSVTFQTIVKNKNGYYGTIDNSELQFSVISGEGVFENGTYTPKSSGTHLIEVAGGNAKSYAIINVTPIITRDISYIDEENYEFASYPQEVTGNISKYKNDYLKLKYNFENTSAIRAAYIRFKTPIELNENDISISFPVLSKKETPEMIKMKIIDKDGNAKLATVQRGFNGSDDFIMLSLSLKDIALPAKITDLYVAQDSSEVLDKGEFIFGKITVTSKENLEGEAIIIPQKVKGEDATNTISSGDDSFHIAIYDSFTKENILLDRFKNKKAFEEIKKDSDLIILHSDENLTQDYNFDKTIILPTEYKKAIYDNFDLISIDVSNGGLRKTSSSQWLTLKSDIKNSTNTNIVIIMKGTLDSFTDNDEKELFINVISDLRMYYQKNIWIISYQDYTEYSMEKRIKYLSVNNTNFNTNNPIEVAKNTEYVLISIKKDQMTYEIKRVF